jgi:hypothetical protein
LIEGSKQPALDAERTPLKAASSVCRKGIGPLSTNGLTPILTELQARVQVVSDARARQVDAALQS